MPFDDQRSQLMKNIATLYLISLGTFFVLDLLWLGVFAADFYQSQLGYLLAAEVRWEAALAFYLLFVGGIIHFVTGPALSRADPRSAVKNGALFGLVTYAAFDLTSLALVRNFPLTVVVVDLTWGMILVATVAWTGCRIGLRLGISSGQRE